MNEKIEKKAMCPHGARPTQGSFLHENRHFVCVPMSHRHCPGAGAVPVTARGLIPSCLMGREEVRYLNTHTKNKKISGIKAKLCNEREQEFPHNGS